MINNPLQLLLNPGSIATVGAGNNPLKMGAIQALSIVKDGFPGKFFPIHPTETKVFGYKAYPSAFDLPEAPDLVMFVLPATLVVKIMEDFGRSAPGGPLLLRPVFARLVKKENYWKNS